MRIVQRLGDLTAAEAPAFGSAVARASAALRTVAGAEHVYAMVIGDKVHHLHMHLIPRYPGTPQEFYGFRAAEVRNILDFPGFFDPPARVIT